MTLSLVSNEPITQIPMQFEKEWYLMLNMAMIIYSATFTIHANCFLNAIKMIVRRARTWVHQLHLFQTAGPFACHIYRLTDYFWIADCKVKGYFNHVSYFMSVSVMDFLQAYRFHKIIEGLPFKYTFILKWFNLIFFAAFVILTKVINGIVYTYYITAYTDVATFCNIAFTPERFLSIILVDIISHLCAIPMLCSLIYLQYLKFKRQNPDVKMNSYNPYYFLNTIGLDDGIVYILIGDVVIIVMFFILALNLQGVVNPEVFYQVKWAAHTKCISLMMEHWSKKSGLTRSSNYSYNDSTLEGSNQKWQSKDQKSTLCDSHDCESAATLDHSGEKGSNQNLSTEFLETA